MSQQQRPTGGLAGRYGLVRPVHGRYLAGVCAAIGRATNTDPVLWRVILAVLICFGGVGAVAYLVLWLLTPEEGDTASPVEAMLGRGESGTPPLLVALLGVIAALLALYVLPRPLYLVLLGAAAVLAILLITQRTGAGKGQGPAWGGPPAAGEGPAAEEAAGGQPTSGAATPPAGTPAAATPPAGTPAAATPPAGMTAAVASPADSDSSAGADSPVSPPAGGTPPSGTPAGAASPAPATPSGPIGGGPAGPRGPEPVTLGGWPAGFEQPTAPFAPRGPFGPPPPPPPAPPQPPQSPRPRRERSSLPLLTISMALLMLGVVGALDLAGVANVPVTGYLVVALATTGAGLVVGAWLGRGRSLIALGIVLSLALPATQLASDLEPHRQPVATSASWTPSSIATLQDEYAVRFGDGHLDLRQVDFSGQRVTLAVRVRGGEVRVLLPPEVAVTAQADVVGGNVNLFGMDVGGLSTGRSVTDPGSGADAGELVLELDVRFGYIEVRR